MIKKCDFKGCEKAGVCRAPRSRAPGDYYWFCKEHAAEYNKNWNYYAGMTTDEIEEDWERETFGISDKERAMRNAANTDYVNFIRDFLNGLDFTSPKGRVGSGAADGGQKNSVPHSISSLLSVFDLAPTANWREVQTKYRTLAKKYHPDTAKNKKSAATEFTRISAAYAELKKYFKK